MPIRLASHIRAHRVPASRSLSHQFDVTAEWYFSQTGSLTVVRFNKQLKDVIIKQSYGYNLADDTGKPYTFMVTGPVNGADGHARGAEIAYQQYSDMLRGVLQHHGEPVDRPGGA